MSDLVDETCSTGAGTSDGLRDSVSGEAENGPWLKAGSIGIMEAVACDVSEKLDVDAVVTARGVEMDWQHQQNA